MLTSSERFTQSTNGESCTNDAGSRHEPAGDSCVLLIPVGPDFKPNGATATPGERSLKMPRDLANQIAVELNRRILKERDDIPNWHVVLYSPTGFHVLKVQVPHGWRPEDEYSLPPTYFSDAMNCEARQEVKTINKVILLSGETITKWAVHVKPLRPTDDLETSAPEDDSTTAEKIELDEKRQSVALSEDEQKELDTLNQSLQGCVDIIDDGYAIRYVLRNYYLGEFTRHGHDEPSGVFRNLAGQLLDAANKLEGKDGPAIGTLSPLYHEFTFEGFETVTLRVDVNSREDEEKAMQTARQFLLAHSTLR